MRKTAALVALLVGVVLLSSVTACVPARAESRVEKTLSLEPGGKFVLEADAGSVDITGSSQNKVTLVISSRQGDVEDLYDIQFEESPGLVRVIEKRRRHGGSFLSRMTGRGTHFQIEVPSQTSLRVKTGGGHIEVSSIRGDADIRTSGGHIEVADLNGRLEADTSGGHITLRQIVGDAKIETSGGHIDVSSLRGSLDSTTSGGHIELKDVTGDIQTSTSGGHISIEGAGGRVSAETSGGSVEVSFAKGNAHGGKLESSGGGIKVKLDSSIDIVVDAETSGGSVSSDLPLNVEGGGSRSNLKGVLGEGGSTLTLRTSAGSIRIGAL